MEERCMRCSSTKDTYPIYHFEQGCWCSHCIDSVMTQDQAPKLAMAIAALVGCPYSYVFSSEINVTLPGDGVGETYVKARIKATDGKFLTVEFARPGVWPVEGGGT